MAELGTGTPEPEQRTETQQVTLDRKTISDSENNMILHDDSSHDKDIYDDSAERDRLNEGPCSSGDSWQKGKKICRLRKRKCQQKKICSLPL